jgi:hypothetical protein
LKRKFGLIIFSIVLTIILVAATPISAAITVIDDFNRADGPIGPNWTDVQNFMQVDTMKAQAGTSSWNAAIYNGVTSTVLEADVFSSGTETQYTGFLMDYLNQSNCIFIKIQDNTNSSGAGFDTIWIYNALHGYGGGSLKSFFFTSQPILTAHMRAELVGGTLTITLSNINGGVETRTYTHSGIPSTGGDGVGIVAYKQCSIDNFAIYIDEEVEVDIDIKPGSFPNSINLNSKGKIPVAILTTETFDATTVDPVSVEFAGAMPLRWAVEDVDDDGDMDLIFFFKAQEVGIAAGDTEATLTGATFGGESIIGTDSVMTVPPST